jgi:hypothetical protein
MQSLRVWALLQQNVLVLVLGLICTYVNAFMQIVQSLRTGGDLAFEEISCVIPFIELAYDCGIENLDAPQPGCIRGFKTHTCLPLSAMQEGTKCIYIARNPIHVRPHLSELHCELPPLNFTV